MRIAPELKSFDQQLRGSRLTADRSGDGIAASGIAKDGSGIAAQLIGAICIQLEVDANRKRVISGGDIHRALKRAGFKGVVDAVSDVSSGGAGCRNRRLGIQDGRTESRSQKKYDEPHEHPRTTIPSATARPECRGKKTRDGTALQGGTSA
jgi:hypothetical protein